MNHTDTEHPAPSRGRTGQLMLAAIIALFLTGCDQADAVAHADRHPGPAVHPETVIAPGAAFDDHGHPARVYGQEICPWEEDSGGLQSGCVVINRVTKQVNVIVTSAATPSGHPETWTVVRRGASPEGLVWLLRPDGSYVSSHPEE